MEQTMKKPQLMLVHSYAGFAEWLELVPYTNDVTEAYLKGVKSKLYIDLSTTLHSNDGDEYENILRDFIAWAENHGYEVYNHSPLQFEYPTEVNGFSLFMATVVVNGSAGFEDTWSASEKFYFKYVRPNEEHEVVGVYFGKGMYRFIERGAFGCHFHDFKSEKTFHQTLLHVLNHPTPMSDKPIADFTLHEDEPNAMSVAVKEELVIAGR